MPLIIAGGIAAVGSLLSAGYLVKETGDSALRITVPLLVIGGTAVLLANKKALKINV